MPSHLAQLNTSGLVFVQSRRRDSACRQQDFWRFNWTTASNCGLLWLCSLAVCQGWGTNFAHRMQWPIWVAGDYAMSPCVIHSVDFALEARPI